MRIKNSLSSGKSAKQWIVLCAAFATFMGTLDAYIVSISLPVITNYFHVSTGEAAWVTIIYLLILSSTLILFGKLADRIGLKKLFILGYIIFTAGSLICGVSGSINMLIAARIIQGLGGSVLRVVAYAIVPKFLPSEIRGWGFGMLSTASALGVTVGAPVGGFITSFFSWHWAFLVNVPVGIAAIALVQVMLPQDSPVKAEKTPFDIAGAAMSFLGLLALTYALNMGQTIGWSSPVIIVCFAASIIIGWLFVRQETSCRDPLLNLNLFKTPSFTFGCCATFMTIMFMSGNSFLYPFYLQIFKGLRVEQAGLVLLSYSLVYIPFSQIAGRLSDRIMPALLCGFSMISASMSCLVFVLTIGSLGYVPMFLFILWSGISCAFFISPNNKSIMGLAPEESQGSASGIINTINQFSSVVGVCLFEMIFSVYTGEDIISSGSHTSSDNMLMGFQSAYILALVSCLLSMIFSFLSIRRKNLKKQG